MEAINSVPSKPLPVEGALQLFKQGFKVFPVKRNTKEPLFYGWQKWAATCNEQKIKEVALFRPYCNWGVALYLSGYSCVDIDCKDGAKGFETLKWHESEGRVFSHTLTIETPSGGRHFYYKGSCQNTQKAELGPGIDTRGEGGYVVAPGSVFKGKAYKIIDDTQIVNLPSWVPEMIQKNKDPSAKAASLKIKTQTSGMQIPKGQRDNGLTSLAGLFRYGGLNEQSIEGALRVVNQNQTEEPLPDEQIKKIAHSIGKKPPGGGLSSISNGFSTPQPFIRHSAADIIEKEIPPRDWILEKQFLGKFITATFSMPGIGKSSFTMLEAVAVATGRNLTGHEVIKKGAVWLFNLEDPREEMERRLIAIRKHYYIPKEELSSVFYDSGRDQPLVFARIVNGCIEINEELVQLLIKEIIARKIVLLVIDPLIRSHEMQENDNVNMDKLLSTIQKIADATGCAINLVHHTNKNGAEGTGGTQDAALARGASSFIGSVRESRFLSYPKEGDLKRYGLSKEQEDYIFVTNPKANLAKRSKEPKCYKHVEILLDNGDKVGVLEYITICAQNERIAKERRDLEAALVLPVLCRELCAGQEKPIKEILAELAKDAQAAEVFKHYKNDRNKENRLRTLFEKPIKDRDKSFILKKYPERRAKFHIACESNPV